MKTIIYTTCYLNGDTNNGKIKVPDARYLRHIKYLEFIESMEGNLHFDEMWFIDNASDPNKLEQLGGNLYNSSLQLCKPATTRPYLNIVCFTEFLPRVSIWEYPYVYRAIRYLDTVKKFTGAEKIIFLDTDFFILSKKLCEYINNLTTGFTSFECKKYKFPEFAMCILCDDVYHKWLDFAALDFIEISKKKTIECCVPFTHVDKTFVGDRFGETATPQTDDMDWYGQAPVQVDLKFNK